MPGIAGIIGGHSPEHPQAVRRMLDAMLYERDYVSGTHFEPSLGILAGWVAHPGSYSERMGGACAPGRASLVVAGQCFGGDDGAGWPLSRYESKGVGFVEEFDGSFSGLLLDPAGGRALLFNDRFGIERIYYCEIADALYFASEAKALLGVLPELRRFDDKGVVQFLAYGTTLSGTTLFRGVRVMEPGSVWTFERQRHASKRSYFHVRNWEEQPRLTAEEYRRELAVACRDAVRMHLQSDTNVGVSITGGLDTRMIMACLPTTAVSPTCYTFAGIEGETLDVRIGRHVADACGLEHRTLRIGNDFLDNYGDFLDRTVYITDGYAGALGAHEIYFNALARQLAPVRVTGNFGSEILRGMSTFRPSNLTRELLEPEWRHRVAACVRECEASFSRDNPAVFAALHEIPTIHYGIPAAARSQLTLRTPFISNKLAELAIRAPVKELASPAACAGLIEHYRPDLAAIATDRGVIPSGGFRPWSRLYAELTFKLDYLHKEGLPPILARLDPALSVLSRLGVLGLHKYLPYRRWFGKELVGYARDVLEDRAVREMPWWSTDALRHLLAAHQSGRSNNLREIHAVLTLAAVERTLLRS